MTMNAWDFWRMLAIGFCIGFTVMKLLIMVSYAIVDWLDRRR